MVLIQGKRTIPTRMEGKTVLKWLLALLLVALIILYTVYPLVWFALTDAFREHMALSRAQWHRRRHMSSPHDEPPSTTEEDEMVDVSEEEQEDVDVNTKDYIDYTPASSVRVRIVHPKTADALARLLDAGRTDRRIVSQIVVPSSTQYKNVTAERPIVITTYR